MPKVNIYRTTAGSGTKIPLVVLHALQSMQQLVFGTNGSTYSTVGVHIIPTSRHARDGTLSLRYPDKISHMYVCWLITQDITHRSDDTPGKAGASKQTWWGSRNNAHTTGAHDDQFETHRKNKQTYRLYNIRRTTCVISVS